MVGRSGEWMRFRWFIEREEMETLIYGLVNSCVCEAFLFYFQNDLLRCSESPINRSTRMYL